MEYDIQIRRAKHSDADDILNIMKEAFTEYKELTGAETVEALSETAEDVIKGISSKNVFAAVLDGRVIGSVRTEITDKTAYLTRFAVKMSERSKGIGRMLLNAVDEDMKRNGVEKLCLHTCPDLELLMAFYKRHGFYIVSEENSRGYRRALLEKEYK